MYFFNDMFNYFIVVLTSRQMADQVFMFMTTACTMAAFAALLFVSRGVRTRSGGLTATSSSSSAGSTSSSSSSLDNVGRKVKKYSSDGKPIYED
jgi:hypothetical protein